jgi:hypothetical protein
MVALFQAFADRRPAAQRDLILHAEAAACDSERVRLATRSPLLKRHLHGVSAAGARDRVGDCCSAPALDALIVIFVITVVDVNPH